VSKEENVFGISKISCHHSMQEALLSTVLVATMTLVSVSAAAASDSPTASAPGDDPTSPASVLAISLGPGPLDSLVTDVLARNPDLAALRAGAAAARERPAQASSLPDPVLGVTLFPSAPQTRVGPQDLSLSLAQKFPWFGKQDLMGKAASQDALTAAARVQAVRLMLVTETRRLYYELAFVTASQRIVGDDRATLVHYEELARSRYAAGVGLEQAVVKVQAEISKADARLLELDTRRAELAASLNALRDRANGSAVAVDSLPRFPQVELDQSVLRSRALGLRPEIASALAQVDKSKFLVDLARKRNWPDLTLGFSYVFVGKRDDPAGIASPPPDNGSNIIGVSVGFNLPLWRKSIDAGEAEAAQHRLQAAEGYRSETAAIDRDLDDLTRRVPLAWDRLRLYEDVLGLQAEQSLHSAEAAYSATTIGALDLLDAERVLLEVRLATARARADYAIALARLEGTVGAPVVAAGPEGEVK